MKQFLSALALALPISLMAQTLTPVFRANLPAGYTESSGIAVAGRNSLWTHNDSGGANELLEMDSMGVALRTVIVRNATNVDWEDVCIDSAGFVYVADVGNNAQNRTNLVIYKLPPLDTLTGDSVDAEKILFSYPDQDSFPPSAVNWNFDVEALVHKGNHLYLFSKDESDPYTGWCKRYRLPDTAGTFVAELQDSFHTGSGPWVFTSVTSASLSPDGQTLVLLASSRMWFFTGFTGDDFFAGAVNDYSIGGGFSQKEAICFASNDELYLTDELFSGLGGKLYYLDLTPPVGLQAAALPSGPMVFPNPAADRLSLDWMGHPFQPVQVTLWTPQGMLAAEWRVGQSNEILRLDQLPDGCYLLRLQGAGWHRSERLILQR